ncbi:carbohydrate porin [Erwinia persicina]|uniref:carbohydrate porin n=1 Tax=Erwinia persicina TaxID=55211 RepID=UPI00178572D7|nr:carbohydrate porin [Erwinia persicina]MBD8162928.1 carbohydrate porin [Erwinia persicina]MBD8214335.1 carbohydrate porin [Erwinia persicina]
MERTSHLNQYLYAASLAALLLASGASARTPLRLPHYQAAPVESLTTDANAYKIPEEYRNNKPQPLMRGDGFNYNLYYNYRLTPHIILRPNLQQTTKPGSVSDDAHLFVGGLSAGINF